MSKKRSPISTVLAVFVVGAMLVVLLFSRVRSLFRPRYVPIDELKFPVLVVQPEGVPLFAEWDSTPLQKFEEKSPRRPANGSILIDSDFNQFTQENVKRAEEGDIKAIGRFLFPGVMRIKYTFDLRRSKTTGLEALRALIRTAPPFSDDPATDAAMRAGALEQTTMAGVLDALHFIKPPDQPTTSPVMDGPTTEPVEATTIERDPDRPGGAN